MIASCRSTTKSDSRQALDMQYPAEIYVRSSRYVAATDLIESGGKGGNRTLDPGNMNSVLD